MILNTDGSGYNEEKKPVSKRRYGARTSTDGEHDLLKPLRARRNHDSDHDDYDPDYELIDDELDDDLEDDLEDDDDLDIDDLDDYDEDDDRDDDK